jgi:hypothetical protein
MNQQRRKILTYAQAQPIQMRRLFFFLFTFLFVFVLTTVGLVTLGAAQELEGEPPERGLDREAPPRDAVVLERERISATVVRTVVELPATADAYIASERPNQNFGADALFLGYNLAGDHYGAQRMLLRFDVESQIPPGAVVTEAYLRLRLSFSGPVDDEPMGTVLRRVNSFWDEFTVTWNTEPAWTPVDDTTFVGSELTWYEWEITEVVDNWVNGVFDNYGVAIIGDETVQQRERAFYSRETPTDFHPRIVVTYTEEEDIEPPVTTVDPLPDFSPRHFTVSWSGHDPGDSGIAYFDVQYRENEDVWLDWLSGVTFTSTEFVGNNAVFYEFRVRGVDNAGNVEPLAEAEAATTVDNQPPVSQVEPLPTIINETAFSVSWTGHDHGGSGIQYFDVQYRYNRGPWVLWQQQTIAGSALFTAAADGLYEFESRAVDNLGHMEPFSNQPDAGVIVDAEPPFIEPRLWLPLILSSP